MGVVAQHPATAAPRARLGVPLAAGAAKPRGARPEARLVARRRLRGRPCLALSPRRQSWRSRLASANGAAGWRSRLRAGRPRQAAARAVLLCQARHAPLPSRAALEMVVKPERLARPPRVAIENLRRHGFCVAWDRVGHRMRKLRLTEARPMTRLLRSYRGTFAGGVSSSPKPGGLGAPGSAMRRTRHSKGSRNHATVQFSSGQVKSPLSLSHTRSLWRPCSFRTPHYCVGWLAGRTGSRPCWARVTPFRPRAPPRWR